MNDPATIVEQRDAINRLSTSGFAPLLKALEDPRCYARGGMGRIILSRVARRLQETPGRVAMLLREAKLLVA